MSDDQRAEAIALCNAVNARILAGETLLMYGYRNPSGAVPVAKVCALTWHEQYLSVVYVHHFADCVKMDWLRGQTIKTSSGELVIDQEERKLLSQANLLAPI